MKKMIILITIIFTTVIFFNSCSSSNNKPYQPTIEGTWNCTQMSILAIDRENTEAVSADRYVNKAFADVIKEAKIMRVFVDKDKLVYTYYTNTNGTEITYSILDYKLQHDTLYLTGNDGVHQYYYTLSTPVLTSEWIVDKKALDAILIDMDKGRVALLIPDNYVGKITFREIRSEKEHGSF